MRRWRLSVLLLTLVGSVPAAEVPAEYKKSTGPLAVEKQHFDWKDERRDRVVPVTVYLPKGEATPRPVIVFSHGLGGSRDNYEYVGRHWASNGYVCVHPQHVGSDDSVWRGKKNAMEEMRQAARMPTLALARMQDVRFVLDRLTALNRDDATFRGRLDLERIGMAGHSFGAQTTQSICGQTFFGPFGRGVRLADARVKAGIAMSPAAHGSKGDHQKAFATIKVPMLHLTGTRDDGVVVTDVQAADRRIPFDNIAAPYQYLVIFTGGDHMVFTGMRRSGDGSKDRLMHDLIRQCTTAFWDAHLRGDETARRWLAGQLAKTLGQAGTFEMRAK